MLVVASWLLEEKGIPPQKKAFFLTIKRNAKVVTLLYGGSLSKKVASQIEAFVCCMT